MPDARIVKAIFETYLSIRDKDGKLQEPKKQIAFRHIEAAEKATSAAAWIELARQLASAMREEYASETGYNIAWVLTVGLYQAKYFLYKTLHAALAYIVSELDKLKAWDENNKLILAKDFQPDAHLNFFNEWIKSEEQTKTLQEKDFNDFAANVMAGKRVRDICEKLRPTVKVVSTESKDSASEIKPPVVTSSPKDSLLTTPAPAVASVVSVSAENVVDTAPAESVASLGAGATVSVAANSDLAVAVHPTATAPVVAAQGSENAETTVVTGADPSQNEARKAATYTPEEDISPLKLTRSTRLNDNRLLKTFAQAVQPEEKINVGPGAGPAEGMQSRTIRTINVGPAQKILAPIKIPSPPAATVVETPRARSGMQARSSLQVHSTFAEKNHEKVYGAGAGTSVALGRNKRTIKKPVRYR